MVQNYHCLIYCRGPYKREREGGISELSQVQAEGQGDRRAEGKANRAEVDSS